MRQDLDRLAAELLAERTNNAQLSEQLAHVRNQAQLVMQQAEAEEEHLTRLLLSRCDALVREKQSLQRGLEAETELVCLRLQSQLAGEARQRTQLEQQVLQERAALSRALRELEQLRAERTAGAGAASSEQSPRPSRQQGEAFVSLEAEGEATALRLMRQVSIAQARARHVEQEWAGGLKRWIAERQADTEAGGASAQQLLQSLTMAVASIQSSLDSAERHVGLVPPSPTFAPADPLRASTFPLFLGASREGRWSSRAHSSERGTASVASPAGLSPARSFDAQRSSPSVRGGRVGEAQGGPAGGPARRESQAESCCSLVSGLADSALDETVSLTSGVSGSTRDVLDGTRRL